MKDESLDELITPLFADISDRRGFRSWGNLCDDPEVYEEVIATWREIIRKWTILIISQAEERGFSKARALSFEICDAAAHNAYAYDETQAAHALGRAAKKIEELKIKVNDE